MRLPQRLTENAELEHMAIDTRVPSLWRCVALSLDIDPYRLDI